MNIDAESQIKAGLDLNARDVHLWRVNVTAVRAYVSKWISLLTPDEQNRASRFHHPIDRDRFVAARALLRQILGSYMGSDPRALRFTYSEKEKPALGGEEAASGIGFNVSHSGDIALLAFARSCDVGVDVEQIRSDIDTKAIAARFFSVREQEQLAALPASERHQAFFLCWTRKESFIKATGKGLSLPLRQFDVSLKSADQNCLLATRPDPVERTRWTLRDLTVEPGYAAALCVSGADWRLVEDMVQECGP
jgi:4'-phosphopantetheinyl transferase